ncbi:MAG: hypothetical protein M1827_004006 [Pycnora praestabilis]|nr:MAG: hypothetical protein M1827_004006 [Pycnora praestabilis]
MTVEESLFRATESLVLPLPRTFYPAKIPVAHYQLRSLISSPETDKVYYASDKDIYCLLPSLRKRETVAILPFRIQCLVAGYGWVCAGGADNGQFAAIKIDDDNTPSDRRDSIQRHADVDALLPLDLDPESRRQTHQYLSGGATSSESTRRVRPELRIQEHGGVVVNSVTLHRWRHNKRNLDLETVAVITNNDKTVRIFSLTQFRVLRTLEFAVPMNHALISPDSELLVAVGDEPIAYFYQRVVLNTLNPQERSDNDLTLTHYDWRLCSRYRLKTYNSGRVDDSYGCFSTAFSPSGHLCAVASQEGFVTIFDTSLVSSSDHDNAVVEVFQSSRPMTKPGAVRTMYFSPEPWDLLIWAEDHGKIGVADIRDNFNSRQIIEIETEADDVESADVTDLADNMIDPELRELNNEADFIRRYRRALDAEDDAAAVNFAADYIEASAERRRLQRQARDRDRPRDDDPHGLTEHERQILDALRTSRERTEAREQSHQTSPFSVNHVSTPGRMPPPGTLQNVQGGSSLLSVDELLGMQSSSIMPRDNTIAPTLRDYIRERNHERARTTDRSHQPRRRSSVVLSNSTSDYNAPSANATERTTPSLTISPSHLQSTDTSTPPINPWDAIEAAMSSRPQLDAATRLRREREQVVEANFERRQQHWTRTETARRERLRNLYYADGEGIGRYEQSLLRRAGAVNPDFGVGTAGLGMSEDGRRL